MSHFQELEEIAKSATDDFYELLGVGFETNEVELKRAYRKASIKAHPDKNPDLPDAADKFIRLGIARDILIDAKLKAVYDQQRARQRERALQHELLDSKRRKMVDDLERREREALATAKRKRGEFTDAEKREAAEIERITEINKRRRKEVEEKLRRQREEQEAIFADHTPASVPQAQAQTQPDSPAPGQSPDSDRTIKVRFEREGDAIAWDKEAVAKMFEKYGKIDSIVMGKDKKVRVSGEKHRKITVLVLIVFTRLDHAYAAVSDAKRDFPLLESISWLDKEPDLTKFVYSPNGPSRQEYSMMRLKQAEKKRREEPKPTSADTANSMPPAPSTPVATPNKFRASFGGAGKEFGTHGTPKFSFSPNRPSSQEQARMRLREAEKKQLEDEIRRQEAAEEAAEKAAK